MNLPTLTAIRFECWPVVALTSRESVLLTLSSSSSWGPSHFGNGEARWTSFYVETKLWDRDKLVVKCVRHIDLDARFPGLFLDQHFSLHPSGEQVDFPRTGEDYAIFKIKSLHEYLLRVTGNETHHGSNVFGHFYLAWIRSASLVDKPTQHGSNHKHFSMVQTT